MKKKLVLTLSILAMVISTYAYAQTNMDIKDTQAYIGNSTNLDSISIKEIKFKEELIEEMKKETDSLNKENEYLRQEISNLKKELNKEAKEVDAKFHGYTIHYTLNKRYSTLLRENTWSDGTKFTVNGNAYSNGIGFDRLENGDRNYYVSRLYNYNGEHSRLVGYIGVDDLAKNLKDSTITFTVYDNDTITKCYNEFYGDTLYKTQFKKSDGLQKIDVNLKGAKSIIIEFTVEQSSDLNYFLLLEPKLK